MRRLPGEEAFVDIMKDRVSKQHTLEYDTFLRTRFEQQALGRMPGLSKNKMGERKDGSQTLIDTRGLLHLRMQMPHARPDCRHLQLSPGVRLQIELDIFMRNIERVE